MFQCRHTFSKNLIDSGVSLEKVAALLGHARLETTMIYITPSQPVLSRTVRPLTVASKPPRNWGLAESIY